VKFLTDENFEGAIFRGLLRRKPDLDIVRVQDVGLAEVEDPIILDWADREGRILLTHDRKTMPGFAYQRMAEGETIAGLKDLILFIYATLKGQALPDLH
jgi:hypothetical protein